MVVRRAGLAELFGGLGTVALDEVARSGSLLAFQLQFLNFEGCIVAASDEQSSRTHSDFGMRQVFVCGVSFQDLQDLAAKLCVRAGPGLESAEAVQNLRGAARE